MFLQYEHMRNFYQLKYNLQEYIHIDWVATEKIHGTNYSFLCDNKLSVIPCKRTSMLDYNEDFMNHQKVFDKYKNDVIDIYKIIENEENKNNNKLLQIQLYGELFGGLYDQKTSKDSIVIQKKMNYCLENDFMAYDLKITSLSKGSYYYDYDKLTDLFNNLESIKLVPTIMIGNINDILKINPAKFESKVYSYYNLDKIENNFAEGLVIKPVKEKVNKYGDRIIFKLKNPDFSEIQKIQANSKNNYISIIKKYITENRYNNVKSKISSLDINVNLNELFYQDVLQDFIEDYSSIISEKELEECKNILYKINIKKMFDDK